MFVKKVGTVEDQIGDAVSAKYAPSVQTMDRSGKRRAYKFEPGKVTLTFPVKDPDVAFAALRDVPYVFRSQLPASEYFISLVSGVHGYPGAEYRADHLQVCLYVEISLVDVQGNPDYKISYKYVAKGCAMSLTCLSEEQNTSVDEVELYQDETGQWICKYVSKTDIPTDWLWALVKKIPCCCPIAAVLYPIFAALGYCQVCMIRCQLRALLDNYTG